VVRARMASAGPARSLVRRLSLDAQAPPGARYCARKSVGSWVFARRRLTPHPQTPRSSPSNGCRDLAAPSKAAPRGASDPRSGGAWGAIDRSAGPPQARSAPLGGSDPRSGGARGPSTEAQGRPKQGQPPWGAATRAAAERGGPSTVHFRSGSSILTSSTSRLSWRSS
jgi:hypothetical protein